MQKIHTFLTTLLATQNTQETIRVSNTKDTNYKVTGDSMELTCEEE
jgi:hypothetical protein